MIKTMFQIPKLIVVLVAVCIFSLNYSPCNAQLGKLKGGLLSNGSKKNAPALVYDRPFPPSVMYSSFLEHSDFTIAGYYQLSMVSISFIPDKDEKGAVVDYNNPQRFHISIKKEGVEVSNRYYVPQYPGKIYTKFGHDENSPGNKTPNEVLKVGKYEMEFYLDDKLFAKYPFEVFELKTDDPYAEVSSKKFVNGMWNDYGFWKWEDKGTKTQAKRSWNIFYQLVDVKEKSKKIEMYNELYLEGKYIATTGKLDPLGKPNSKVVKNNWASYEFIFYNSPQEGKVSGNKAMKPEDYVDGKYEIKSFIDGKVSSYKFEIADGKIVPKDRQDRKTADPLYFIEGINETFWFKKEQ